MTNNEKRLKELEKQIDVLLDLSGTWNSFTISAVLEKLQSEETDLICACADEEDRKRKTCQDLSKLFKKALKES